MSSVGPRGPLRLPEPETLGGNFIVPIGHVIRLLLIGKTGGGKSKTGNTILGETKFASVASAAAVTKECKTERFQRDGRTYELTDTPGLYDNKEDHEATAKKILTSARDFHVILYVVPIGRYTEEDYNTYQRLKTYFGEDVKKYVILVFTRGDDLERDGNTILDYLTTLPAKFREVLEELRSMYVVLNNIAGVQDREQQLKALLDKAMALVANNRLRPYRNPVNSADPNTLNAEVIRRVTEAERRELEPRAYVRELTARRVQAERQVEQANRRVYAAEQTNRDLGSALLMCQEQNENLERKVKIAEAAAAGVVVGALGGGLGAAYFGASALVTVVSAASGGVIGGGVGGLIGTQL